MICIARTFGAPDTVPAGKHRPQEVEGSRRRRASSPTTSETRWVMCENRSGSRKRATWTVPGRHTRDRSLRPRSTSITCSARSLSEASSRSASPSPGCVEPAIGFSEARVPSHFTRVSGEEPTRAYSVELEQEQVGRGVDAAQRPVEGERRDGGRPFGALGEDDLEGVPAPDELLARGNASLVLGLGREARGGGTAGPSRAAAAHARPRAAPTVSPSPRSTSATPRA